QDRHVDGAARLVGELLQVGSRDLAQLHGVDRREAEVEDARAEPVAPCRRVLLEVAEPGERGDVAVRRAAAELELAGGLADGDERPTGRERGEDGEPALERLGSGGDTLVL